MPLNPVFGISDVLAERVRQGLPLWHPSDRLSFDENEQPRKKPR
jgi:hypothetical protein